MSRRRNADEQARDELMTALRHKAQLNRLVTRLTGIASGPNFETALDYVNVNLQHHRFQEAHGHGVRAQYDGLVELLHRHTEHRKAGAVRDLCGQLCSTGSASGLGSGSGSAASGSGAASAAWEWRPAHGALSHGLQALSLLYWLSSASQMVRAPLPSADGRGRDRSRGGDGTAEAATEAEPRAQWGFSDGEEGEEEEEEEGEEEEEEGAAGDAAEAAREAGAGRPGLPRSLQLLDSAAAAGGALVNGVGGAGRRRGRARLSRPPASLELRLLAPHLLINLHRAGGASGVTPSSQQQPQQSQQQSQQQQQQQAQLRLLRETLRALAGLPGAMWAAPAGGEGGEGGEGGTEGGGACWVGPHRSTNRRGGAEGPSPESSSGGPSAQDALLGVLAQAVARAARLRAYAAAQASRRHAPRGVLGFVEALQVSPSLDPSPSPRPNTSANPNPIRSRRRCSG